jgi:hypothetical protein
LEIVMKAIMIATAMGLIVGASAASAAPSKQTNRSPQVTAHEQAPSNKADDSSWKKRSTYKPHWRNKYAP